METTTTKITETTETIVDTSAGQQGTTRSRSSHRSRSSDKSSEESSEESSKPSTNYKRLVVCCDGTWLDSSRTGSESDTFMDSALAVKYTSVTGKIIPPSNVTRLTRAIKSRSDDGIQQIVYYQAGVGSIGNIGDKVVEGATGDGLAEHVREAYSFIANNYDDGDEIFLIGFSRGAFTARSISGLITSLGVMTKAGLASFPIVYKDFAHRYDRRYTSPEPNVPFPNKPSPRDPEYAREMARRRLTTLGVHIKAIGVFDTVGSLGVPLLPKTGILSKVTQIFGDTSDYRFYDTTLDNSIENAFQALALDERREAFSPALWEKRSDNRDTNLIQVWFPGVHSNVGGGYADQELANITLAWMMAMLNPLLGLNLHYIMTQDKENAEYYEDNGKSPRPWSFGKICDSAAGLYGVSGKIVRTPGDYYRTNPKTNDPTNKLLKNTNEYIHASVRARFNMRGPGYADKGDYDPRALKDFRLSTARRVEGLPTPWFWESRGDEGIVLPEAPLRSVEKMLLRMTPEVEKLVLGKSSAPPERKSSKRRDQSSSGRP